MRRGNNSKRSRNNRPNRGGKPPNLNRSLESNTPDGNKVRGNASQLYERYTGLARDAQSAGDRIAAEGYLQYAEHYYRVLSAAGWRRGNGNGLQQPGPNSQGGQVPQEGAPQQNNGQQVRVQPQPVGVEAAFSEPEEDTPETGPAVN